MSVEQPGSYFRGEYENMQNKITEYYLYNSWCNQYVIQWNVIKRMKGTSEVVKYGITSIFVDMLKLKLLPKAFYLMFI